MKKFNSKAEENTQNKKTLKGGMVMKNGPRVQATSTSDVMNKKKRPVKWVQSSENCEGGVEKQADQAKGGQGESGRPHF